MITALWCHMCFRTQPQLAVVSPGGLSRITCCTRASARDSGCLAPLPPELKIGGPERMRLGEHLVQVSRGMLLCDILGRPPASITTFHQSAPLLHVRNRAVSSTKQFMDFTRAFGQETLGPITISSMALQQLCCSDLSRYSSGPMGQFERGPGKKQCTTCFIQP